MQYVTRMAAKRPEAGLDTLLSFFDVVGHVERFDETILLLTDAAGLQSPTACNANLNTGGYQRDNASEWQLVSTVLRPSGLVPWYSRRLRAFDARNQERGPTFARRVQRLSQLRGAPG